MSVFTRFFSSGWASLARWVTFLLFGYFFGTFLLMALREQVLLTDDIPVFYFPFLHWYGQCLQNNVSFLWTPDIYGGLYLHGDGQQGMFHPLHLLLFRFLPSTTAFAVHIAVAFGWLALGVYFLFRHWRMSVESALAGSFLCSFGGYMALRLIHPPALEVWAHAPWNVLFLARLALAPAGGARLRYAGLLGLSTASQCLLGHPPYLYLSLLLEAMCAAAFLWESRRLAFVAAAAGGKALGLLCGLSQLIPTWEVTRVSSRAAASYETLATGSLHPAQFLQWLNPSMTWGDQSRVEYGTFMGVGVVLLAIYYYLAALRSGQATDPGGVFPRRLLVWGAGVSIVMALGSYTWLFDLTSSLYPFKFFRLSARHMSLAQFFLAALACLGIDRWVNSSRDEWENRVTRVVAAGWIAGALVLFALRVKAPGLFGGFLTEAFPGIGLTVMGMAMVVFSATAFLVFSYATVPAWRWGFVAICLLEAGLFHGRSYWRFPKVEFANYVEAMGDLPPVAAPGPVADRSESNHLTVAGYRSSGGYVALKPVMRLRTPDFDRLMGVRAFRDARGASWRSGKETAEPPRAWLVSRVMRSENVAKDAAGTDFLAVALTGQDVFTDPAAEGVVRPVREAPGEKEFQVTAGGRMVLVTAERFNDSWRVFLDGKNWPALRVNGDVLGVAVPAGTHTVRLSFAPGNLPGLIGLTAAGLLACALLILVPMKKTSLRRQDLALKE